MEQRNKINDARVIGMFNWMDGLMAKYNIDPQAKPINDKKLNPEFNQFREEVFAEDRFKERSVVKYWELLCTNEYINFRDKKFRQIGVKA